MTEIGCTFENKAVPEYPFFVAQQFQYLWYFFGAGLEPAKAAASADVPAEVVASPTLSNSRFTVSASVFTSHRAITSASTSSKYF